MRRHDGADADVDRGPERRQLHLIEARARMLDDGETQMRVGRGVAMSRKVFRGRRHPAIVHAADIGARHVRHERDVLPERSDVDDRIARVVVDVDNRIEVDGDAEGAALLGGDPAGAIRQLRVARRRDGHRARQPCRAVHDVADAAFEVRSRQERHIGQLLQPVQQRGGRVWITFSRRAAVAVGWIQHQRGKRLARPEHVHAADLEIADEMTELLEGVAAGARKRRIERRNEQLPGLLVEGHLPERLLDPARGGAVERRLRGLRGGDQHGFHLAQLRSRRPRGSGGGGQCPGFSLRGS